MGVGISAVTSSAASTASPGAAASAPSIAAASPSRGSRSRSKRSRPRPRRPRRPRRSRSSRASRVSRDSPSAGTSAAAGGGTGGRPPSGTSISSCPLSSFVTVSNPRCWASCTNRENFGWPRFFSSNDASISCITCLRRSERITSPLRFMRPTASVTSAHGSQRVDSSSPLRTNPASALYE